MELDKFIGNLEDLISSGKPNKIIPYIKNVKGFLKSLHSLRSMIGMKDLKNNIVSQIKYYFLNQVRDLKGEKTSFDSHMFHTVLLGPPGSGKTTAAEILADIWMNLGVLKKETLIDTGDTKIPESQICKSELFKSIKKENEMMKDKVADLVTELLEAKGKINSIRLELLTEKEKIQNFEKYVQEKKITFDRRVFFDLTRKILSLDSGNDFIMKKYTSFQPRKIPNATYVEEAPKKMEEEKPAEEDLHFVPKFIKLRRDDLVGKYVGHTAIKTREALMTGLGKVIFIDEAYELYNVTSDSSSDCFGMECLSAILNFMNEFSDRTIIIFAGYEDLLKKTIFRVQPGLERRIAWTFTLSAYNEEELADIYENQLKEKSWKLEDKEKIVKLFKENRKTFKHGGGDTLRLAMYTKTVYSDFCFDLLVHNKEFTSCINYDIVSKALDILKENSENQKDAVMASPPMGMYC